MECCICHRPDAYSHFSAPYSDEPAGHTHAHHGTDAHGDAWHAYTYCESDSYRCRYAYRDLGPVTHAYYDPGTGQRTLLSEGP